MKLINVNGYEVHPQLLAAIPSAALREMSGAFGPTTGCGEDIKKVVDLFALAKTQHVGSTHGWDELYRIVSVEGYRPTTMKQMAQVVGIVIQIYIFG